MKTPAIIASLSIVGSLAYATGQRHLVEPASTQGTPSALRIRSVDQVASSPDMVPNDEERIRATFGLLQGIPAQTCATAAWFDPTPLTFDASCGTPFLTPIDVADVNGDGMADRCQRSPIALIYGGPWFGYSDIRIMPASTCLKHFQVHVDATGPRSDSTSVWTTPESWAEQIWNELGISNDTDGCVDSWGVTAEILGWADCDGDKDLDVVVRLQAYHRPRAIVAGSCSEVEPIRYVIDRYHWFRNTGYEKPAQPLAADINGDGRVDGADLGMLLIAWGPTN
jgi:hypothetical protein